MTAAAARDEHLRGRLRAAAGAEQPSWVTAPAPLSQIRASLAADAARRQAIHPPEFQVQAVRPGPDGEWSTCEGAWSTQVMARQNALNLARQTKAPARKNDPLLEVFVVQITAEEIIVCDVDRRGELHRRPR